VEIVALRRRGWSVSAIARHTGRDRKAVRVWLEQGERRRRARAPSVLEPYRAYIERRFADDPHLDATVLLCELRPLGFVRSYQTLTRELRRLELRPECPVCKRGGHRLTIELPHEPGEELQLEGRHHACGVARGAAHVMSRAARRCSGRGRCGSAGSGAVRSTRGQRSHAGTERVRRCAPGRTKPHQEPLRGMGWWRPACRLFGSTVRRTGYFRLGLLSRGSGVRILPGASPQRPTFSCSWARSRRRVAASSGLKPLCSRWLKSITAFSSRPCSACPLRVSST
jgi:hypothetical protein